MTSRDRVGGAEGTTSSPARKALLAGWCDLPEGPSEERAGLVEEVETRRAVPMAIGEPVHPDPEDWLSLLERTTGGSGSKPLRRRGPPLPCRSDPRCAALPLNGDTTLPEEVSDERGSLPPRFSLLANAWPEDWPGEGLPTSGDLWRPAAAALILSRPDD